MTIKVLPPEIANRIAAGEVVERPASVVKELIENSIDAGAREIQVEIQEGGRRLIRVNDDGVGIPASEIEVAFARHATSKLTRAEDLEHIVTLGFRGEALASIASVSQMTAISRSRDEEVGVRVDLEAGQLVRKEPIGRRVGTTIMVEHLFANVPARLKFLRTPVTEAGHVSELIAIYAMAHPGLRFRLVNNGRTVFRSDGTGDLRDVLLTTYGADLAGQMIPLQEECLPADEVAARVTAEAFRVIGYLGIPSLHRSDRRGMIFFVNGRWIRDRSLMYAVTQAYHTLLPAGRFPFAVLSIHLDPAEVDVNVHPTKTEVRFREPGRVFGLVQKSVRTALLRGAPIPQALRWGAAPNVGGHAPGGIDWERREALMNAGRQQISLDWNGKREEVEADCGLGGRLPMLRVVGQVRQMYIIAEGEEGLYLIDQHAAHERVLYEQLRSHREGHAVASQQLLEPEVITLGGRESGLLIEHLPALSAAGFEIELFGDRTFVLRSVPAVLGQECRPGEKLVEVLTELEQGVAPLSRARESSVMAAVCKVSAVKAGQTLSHTEMTELVRQLEETSSPRTCPHGRPTMIHLSAQQLAREFSRI